MAFDPDVPILIPQHQTGLDRHKITEWEEMAKEGHGWVLPRPDGTRANCGGPNVCRMCTMEKMLYATTSRVTVMEGFNLKEGDKLLLIAPPNATQHSVHEITDMLTKRFPGVDITIVAGFTGVQVHKQDPMG